MLGGWIDDGIKPNNILVVDPGADNLGKAAQLGCRVFSSPLLIEAGYKPDVIILAVKPQVIADVLSSYQTYAAEGALVISIAAGARLPVFEASFGTAVAIIRTMPNTPAAVRRGMIVSCANNQVSTGQRDVCDQLMRAIGTTAWVDDESLMDAVTGLSGSGPAYVFYMIQTMKEAGIAAGLPDDLALTLAKATVAGAGELALQTSDSIEQLRKNVTSPNGTTAAGLEVLMGDNALGPLMKRTIAAAAARSRELG